MSFMFLWNASLNVLFIFFAHFLNCVVSTLLCTVVVTFYVRGITKFTC